MITNVTNASFYYDIFIAKLGNVITEINNAGNKNSILISPNPATKHLKISSLLLEQKSTIELFDITGRRVFYSKSAIKNPQSEIVIPVSAFERGIYMLRAGSVARKVVLQ